MNPNAKEFVPAHLLKKRQDEDAQKVNDLSKQLDKVELQSDTNATSPHDNKQNNENGVSNNTDSNTQSKSTAQNSESGNSQIHTSDNSPTAQSQPSNANVNNNNVVDPHTPTQEELDDLTENRERHDYKNGVNTYEFNGEEFVVPDEDEFEQSGGSGYGGYDFGNDEDNENDDVQNAFEEFLKELPKK